MKTWRRMTGCWFAILCALVVGALSVGCRSSSPEPVFSGEPTASEVLEANSRADKAATAESNSRMQKFRFQAGDKLSLTSPDPPGLHIFRVGEDGTFTLPSLGTFVAAGKTFEELWSEIVRKDPRYQQFGLQSCNCELVYNVSGEVNAPGPKSYLNGTTVARAIQAAGGFTKLANTNSVKLVHADGRSETVNLRKSKPGAYQETPVLPNDSITVKRRGFFAR